MIRLRYLFLFVFAGNLADDALGNLFGRFRVVLEFHRVRRPTLGERAQLRRILEHLRERHFGANHLASAEVFHFLDHGAARGQVAYDVAHFLLGRFHFDSHNRLEQHRVGLTHAVLESENRGHLECVLVRVHLVVRPVVERDLDIHHGEAREHAVRQCLLDALSHRGYELFWHPTALDGIDELVARAGRLRIEPQLHVTVLTASARLAGELAFLLDRLSHGLAGGNLRRSYVRFHAELPRHAVDADLHMQLSHAGDDGLAG